MQLRYSRSTDVVQPDLSPELPFNDSPSGRAWTTQEVVVVKDVATEQTWPKLMEKLRAARLRTYCALPLTAGDRRIGVLELCSLPQARPTTEVRSRSPSTGGTI